VLCASRPTPQQIKLLESRILAAHGTSKLIRPTQQIFEWKKHDLKRNMTGESGLVCGPGAEGCDHPDTRDSYNTNTEIIVSVVVNVVCRDDGICPLGPNGYQINGNDVTDQMTQLEKDFSGTRVRFSLTATHFYRNTKYYMLSPYGESDEWFYELSELKDLYAVSPTTQLNVFVTGQRPGDYGTLLGIGTFPWDAESITKQGGFWVNAEFFGEGQKTAAHELGHNVGLWHSFHGVSEVSCTSPCAEKPHDFGDKNAAFVGDFIETTQATPTNFNCRAPTTVTCSISNWRNQASDWQNYMSYTPDSCMASFQPQQGWRARCFLCTSIIKGQIQNHDTVCKI